MSSAAVPNMPSAAAVVVAPTSFDDLRLGRSGQFVVGRLLRFWDSRNIKKQGEFMGITLLFLDAQNSVIHGFIPAARSGHYRPGLRSGSIVKVSSFEVARCTNMYKITDSPFVIRFLPQTTIDEVLVDAPVINLQKFMLRKFEHLQALANTNLELPDVVGMISSVQGSDLSDTRVTTRVVVRFVVEPNVEVYLSLWDDAAATFRGLISSGEGTKSVMVVTTVNPKIFGGNLYLNSTPATKFYFDLNLPAIAQFTAGLSGPVGEAFPCIDTKERIKKKENVSIGDLTKFISNSDEQVQTQEAEFICKARVLEVLQHNGWSFVSCTGCSRKLDQSGTSLRCNRCVNANVTGVIKYRVELSVDDGNDNATFVVFNREMLKLTNKDAATLTVEEMNGGGGEQLPQCLQDLGGKEFVFHIRVTPFNFTPNHRTFTVCGISDHIEPETFNTKEASIVGGKSGEASASGSTLVEGGGYEANPTGGEVKEGSRKRPRE
ncbi:uncharacterized protein LOC108842180 isoform X1 [Raphanus sativus]|uniref:Uncharacterized protein LOC108842180 isoform X1 n=1 Tax=Raphanus sativus TaxID=3726 RepID=A0A6J0MDK0_RAPSA|nr:uncharacterized protein LOC108842180 isoform X1 [Raphanus sativus]